MEFVLALKGNKVDENDYCDTTGRFLRDGELVLSEEFDSQFVGYVPDDIDEPWLKEGIKSLDGKETNEVMYLLLEVMANTMAKFEPEEFGEVLVHLRMARAIASKGESPLGFIVSKATRMLVETVHKRLVGLGDGFGDGLHAMAEFLSTGPEYQICVTQVSEEEEVVVPEDVTKAVDDLFSKLGI